MNTTVLNKNYHDFEVVITEGLLKLKPCNAEAKKWIEINYLRPAGLNLGTHAELKEVAMQAYELERVLRRLMNQAFKVKFVQPIA